MFRLAAPDQSYTRVVQIQKPIATGETQAASFTAQFKLLPQDQLGGLSRDDSELLHAVLSDWSDIETHEGAPLTFSREALETLCQIPYWRRSVVLDYFDFVSGLPAKN